MKMGNTAPRAGLEPTSLAFWDSVLPFHHIGSLMTPLYPSMQLLASEVSADYYTYIYIQTHTYIHNTYIIHT